MIVHFCVVYVTFVGDENGPSHSFVSLQDFANL